MTTCLVCGHDKLFIVAEAGLSKNVECGRCGSLHLYVEGTGKWELLRAGKPKPKVMLEKELVQEFETDQEALAYIRANWERGMYMVDSGGVVATDPLHHP